MAGKQVELGAEFMHGDATAIAVLAARHRLRLWWLCTWAQVRRWRRVPCAHAAAPRVCRCGAAVDTAPRPLQRAFPTGRWRPAFGEGA